MTITRFLTISAAVMAGAASLSLAHAQQVYPVPPGAYSPAPHPGYPGDYRRGQGAPNFDQLEDDDGQSGRPAAAGPDRSDSLAGRSALANAGSAGCRAAGPGDVAG